jgi:hypothetical protein
MLELPRETPVFKAYISGAARPIVSNSFALVFYVLLKIEVLEINVGHTEHVDWSYYLAAFLCGYSERLAGDIVGRLHPG